jgi:hypothetical protein
MTASPVECRSTAALGKLLETGVLRRYSAAAAGGAHQTSKLWCSMSDIDTRDATPPNYDVFISYAHDDDNKLVDETVGWVEQFERDFRVTLKEQLGRPPEIWRDSDITPNDDFEKKIVHRLARSIIFLPVLSRIFINRPYCLLELRTFADNAEKQLATYVGTDGEKKRIFVVEKLPVERDRLPQELQCLGGRFQFHDSEQTLRPALSSKDSRYRDIYYTVLNRLSKTAADLIQLAERSSALKTNDNAAPKGPAVYLAETTSDLSEQREVLRDDLIDSGYQVLPELELPRDVKKYTESVKACLERAVLSVHVVGREYGYIPEGEKELSNVRLQHRLALEQSERNSSPSQVIWLAQRTEVPSDERQQAFLDYLQNNERVHAHAELIEGDIESLKTDLLEKLAKLKAGSENKDTPAAPAATPIEHPRVYIICTAADRSTEQFKALRTHLYERGCETRMPTEDGAEQEIRKAHEYKLQNFDAFLVYAGAGSEAWLEAQLDDFYKFLRSRPQKVLAKAVYIAPPKTAAKEDVETHEATVLRAGDGFNADLVEPFLRLCGKSAVSG